LRPFIHDLPELPELDNLFSPEGPILEAQMQAAKLFGSSETWFLVGGTTCGIQAAIMATCSPGEHIVLPRNSHISAISAMVLSGAIPKYIMPGYDCKWDIAGGVTPSQVSLLGLICFCISKAFLKQFEFYFIFFFASN
jgi:arginine/lysine/ornithine decarboxylase